MIAIVNVTPQSEYDPAGVSEYEVRINRYVVARFRHSRPKGLAACLRAAAKAVDEARKELGPLFPYEAIVKKDGYDHE